MLDLIFRPVSSVNDNDEEEQEQENDDDDDDDVKQKVQNDYSLVNQDDRSEEVNLTIDTPGDITTVSMIEPGE